MQIFESILNYHVVNCVQLFTEMFDIALHIKAWYFVILCHQHPKSNQPIIILFTCSTEALLELLSSQIKQRDIMSERQR